MGPHEKRPHGAATPDWGPRGRTPTDSIRSRLNRPRTYRTLPEWIGSSERGYMRMRTRPSVWSDRQEEFQQKLRDRTLEVLIDLGLDLEGDLS